MTTETNTNIGFIEVHILQNFPPSNLNRDDLGQPKECDFGGYRRARISSQCQKRAIRYVGKDLKDPTSTSIFEQYTAVPLSIRTKMIGSELTSRLVARGKTADDSVRVAVEFARVYSSRKGKMDSKKPSDTSVLLFMSQEELDEIAQDLFEMNWTELLPAIEAAKVTKSRKDDKEDADEKATAKSPLKKFVDAWIKQTTQRPGAPDIALFGRMLADKPETNIDAACQVAHAISTHAIQKAEIDYFTAVDEIKQRNNDPGAAFLDIANFTSACFYRYARIDWRQLNDNLRNKDLQDNDLDDLAVRTVEGFLRAVEAAIPPGKKNSHAQEVRPSFMLAVLRSPQSSGWSLVNAFQKPVGGKDESDLVLASVKRLEKHFEHLFDFYGGNSVQAVAVALPDGTVTRGQLDTRLQAAVTNYAGWIESMCNPLRKGA